MLRVIRQPIEPVDDSPPELRHHGGCPRRLPGLPDQPNQPLRSWVPAFSPEFLGQLRRQRLDTDSQLPGAALRVWRAFILIFGLRCFRIEFAQGRANLLFLILAQNWQESPRCRARYRHAITKCIRIVGGSIVDGGDDVAAPDAGLFSGAVRS